MADPEDIEDAQRLREICEGRAPANVRAYEAIDKRYRPKFKAFFRRFQRNPDDLLDLCQTTFLKIFARACQFRDDGKASAWLWTVARNTLFDSRGPDVESLNISQGDREDDDGDPLMDVPDPRWDPQKFENLDFADRVLAILDKHSSQYASAVWLRVVLGEDYDVVGAALGKQGGNARQFISECMQRVDTIAIGLEEGKTPDQILRDLNKLKKARREATT